MTQWSMKCVGRSFDNRTNVWRIVPGCGHQPFSAATTLMSFQQVECPKCGACAFCDYNAGTIRPSPEATA